MARILVTGGSGFIGGHLVARLVAQGDHVRCLVRAGSSRAVLEPLGVEFVEGDITDGATLARAVQGVDVVFQASGLTTARRSDELFRVNGQGTERLVEACAAQASPPTLVHVSSLAAAGPTRRGSSRTELQTPAPVSHYGRSKLAGELAVRRAAGRVPSTIVRPGIVFGPRDRLMLPIYQAIRRFRVHVYPGLTAPHLSYIYAHDLVELLLAAWQRGRRVVASNALRSPADRAIGIYFATADEHPNYADLGKLIAHAMGVRHCLVMPLMFPLPWIAAGVAEALGRLTGQTPGLNFDKIREAAEESWVCAGDAARTQLDFRPSGSLAEQFRATLAWYLDAGWL